MIIIQKNNKGELSNSPLFNKETTNNSMQDYLDIYGWNFSKKACEFAINNMHHSNKDIEIINSLELHNKLRKYNITIINDCFYNALYTYHMSYNDYMGSSITDEHHLLLHVKDIIDDEDNPGGNIFRKWYADCIQHNLIIDWKNLI